MPTRVGVCKAIGNLHQLLGPARPPPKLSFNACQELTMGQQLLHLKQGLPDRDDLPTCRFT